MIVIAQVRRRISSLSVTFILHRFRGPSPLRGIRMDPGAIDPEISAQLTSDEDAKTRSCSNHFTLRFIAST